MINFRHNFFLRYIYSFVHPKPTYFHKTKVWGLSAVGTRQPRLIVSLTSFPARIRTVSETIQSILNQHEKADRVLLWLAEEQFPGKESELPRQLLKLQEYGLEIKWCNDIRSYKKLVPALREFPDDIIVTTDDDVYYPPTWLGNLYQSYHKYPCAIHCNRSSRIQFNENGFPAPYNTWTEQYIYQEEIGYGILMTGVGGVLYPPHSLYKDVTNERLFMSMADKADDIWFWAMALLQGTQICVIDQAQELFDPVFIVKNESLWSYNQQGNNDAVFGYIYQHYPQLFELFKK